MHEIDTEDAGAAASFYAELLQLMRDAGLPFLVGGSYAFTLLTGIQRPTKDLDIYIRQADWERVAALAGSAGWSSELSIPQGLGKLLDGEHFVAAIFNSGNGLSPVDDEWFRHAVPARMWGHLVLLTPVEESVWTKAFVMERERYDGADVAHLLLAAAPTLDWQRLLDRFGPHWRVLLAHLVMFGFIYPGERALIPPWLMAELLDRMQRESQIPPDRARWCAGTLISRQQYLPDVEQRGYRDIRLSPHDPMTPDDIDDWTAALDTDKAE